MRHARIGILSGCAIALCATSALAGSHNWRWSEVYTNANGRVQFLEMHCLSAGENGIDGLDITVVVGGITVNTLTIPAGALPGNTDEKKLLFATNDFANLPGAPARDYVLPNSFIPTSGAFTLRYNPPGNYDTNVIGAGVLPTDGINSLKYTSNPLLGGNGNDTFVTNQANDPVNYNGIPGSVNGSCLDADLDGYGNPGDPDCANGGATDCNDSNVAINPGALENDGGNNCADTVDNDCDTLADCEDTGCATSAVPECVPTVSEWGVLALALLTLSAGSIMLRQRA